MNAQTGFFLDQVLGNGDTTAALKRALETGRLPHAILLTAPDGAGRGFAARCLAADYLYPGGGAQAQAVLGQQSPELLVVTGEGKSGQIPVDSIRAVRSEIFHSSLSAAGRVVWIRDAHRMAAPAANALLKVLEEPPPGALFILTAPDPTALPFTIQSRCAAYALGALPAGVCEARLQSALADLTAQGAEKDAEGSAAFFPPDPGLPELLAALYGGRIGMGLRVLQNPGRLQILRDALAAVDAAAARDTYRLLCIFSNYEGRAEGERARRECLLADMAEAMACALRGETAAGLPPLHASLAARLLPPLADCRQALAGNAAPKITFAALAVRLKRAA